MNWWIRDFIFWCHKQVERTKFFKKCLSIPTEIPSKKQRIFANLWFLIHRCNFILGYKATFGLHPEKADSEKNFCQHDQPRFCHYFMIFNKFAVFILYIEIEILIQEIQVTKNWPYSSLFGLYGLEGQIASIGWILMSKWSK